MTLFLRFNYLLTILLVVALTPGMAAAAPKPIRLIVESPNTKQQKSETLQFRAGWPLTFKLRARSDFFFAVRSGGPYPELGLTSWLVFQDLDGCPFLGGRFMEGEGDPCATEETPGDEIFVEFTPDVDFPGLKDEQGHEGLRVDLTDPDSFVKFSYEGQDFEFGPAVSAFVEGILCLPGNEIDCDIDDGIGYGPNDDLPSLVLLSNRGVGRVLESELGEFGSPATGFDPVDPLQARNLAGLMTSVAYELSDRKLATTITTSINVPRYLFSRLRLVDQCFGDPNGCTWAQRVDGGPVEILSEEDEGIGSDSTDPNEESFNIADVELRAFVVQGVAPARVEDCDSNGVINAADARCMGYTRISNEVVIRFRQMGNDIDVCPPNPDPWRGQTLGNWAFIDLDGNGVPFALDCPSGGGRISVRPR